MSLAAAGLSLAGGILDNIVGADNANKERQSQQGMAQDNINMQREFAKHGVRWKVEDAKAAGIHPLAALGAQTHSFSPVTIGSGGEHTPTNFREMGQDISRAIDKTRTAEEAAVAKIQLAQAEAGLESQHLDNQIKATQLKKLQNGPAFPGSAHTIDGQGDSGLVANQPLKRTYTRAGKPHQEVGEVSDVGYARTKQGLVPVPSSDVKERIEDNMIQEVLWSIRNNVLPNFTGGDPPSPDYYWDDYAQAYRKKKVWKKSKDQIELERRLYGD